MELLDADNDAQGDHGDEQEDATSSSSSSKKKIRLKSVVCLFALYSVYIINNKPFLSIG